MVKHMVVLLIFSMLSMSAHSEWKSIGNVAVSLRSDQQIVVNCGAAQVQVTPLADDLVRVRVVRGSPIDEGSWALAKGEWKTPRFEHTDDAQNLTIRLKDLTISIMKNPCRISFLTPEGEVINRDDPAKGMGWDGDQVRVWKAKPAGEMYYGFGEKTGPLERGGLSMVNWNYDFPAYNPATDPVYQSIPFFIGMEDGKAYGIFFDNTYRSSFDMGRESERYYSFGADGGEIDYYFFYGPHPKKVIQRFTELTGRMNLPPLWAIGYQQCRWSYYPEKKVREIASNFRKRKIPCDVIYLDIDYMDGYRCFTWSKENFPNPAKMVSDLARDGFKIVTIIDPGIKRDSSYWVYREGIRGDHFVRNPDGTLFTGRVWPGECVFPDFVSSKAQEWWGSLYKGLVDAGIRGFWNDMNEPSVFDAPGKTFPIDIRHHADGKVMPHAAIHNVYGMQMTRGTYEGLRRLRPNERPFVLTRAGFAGTQRYSAAWTGDNVSSWEHLAMAVPMCLNLGLSGQPFVGPDIGGFIGSPTGELYTRWLQYGVFLPLCRTHTVKGSKDQEPWSYGAVYEKINRKFIELRYQLLPFLYTEFYKASISGLPIMRPLLLEFPDDKATHSIDTQFMVGENILISPVLEAGSTSRWMYLPPGDWYDFWTREKSSGGKWINAPAPLDKLPVFIRAGSVIPMRQVVQYSDQSPIDPLIFEIFPSQTAAGVNYEDDGHTYAYQQGVYRFVTVSVNVTDAVIHIERSEAEGSYVPPKRSLVFAVNDVLRRPTSVEVNGARIQEITGRKGAIPGWSYDAQARRLTITTMDTPGKISGSVRL